MVTLFEPLQAGALRLPNRIIMAPLTRCRAGAGRVPTELMREYYVQRASAGLILSEATAVDPMGVGYPDTPGIWSEEQVAGWRKITDAVHAAGGRIMLQLWHVGRISDPVYLNGALPVAPSAVAPSGHVSLVRPQKPYVTPRALERSELPGIVAAYRRGAENAQRAGFDGVEIHGANGYLLDQFLRDGTNRRTGPYGGSVANRARLLLEVTDAAISVWGAGRVGVRISPLNSYNSMQDSDPVGLTRHVAGELDRRGIAFLHLMRGDFFGVQQGDVVGAARGVFKGALVLNMGYTPEEAARTIAAGTAAAIAFGHHYISNPDLPERIRAGVAFVEPDQKTYYSPGPRGYTDYPAMAGA